MTPDRTLDPGDGENVVEVLCIICTGKEGRTDKQLFDR